MEAVLIVVRVVLFVAVVGVAVYLVFRRRRHVLDAGGPGDDRAAEQSRAHHSGWGGTVE